MFSLSITRAFPKRFREWIWLFRMNIVPNKPGTRLKRMKHQSEAPSSHWLTSLTQAMRQKTFEFPSEGQKWKHIMKTYLEPTHLWAWTTGNQSNPLPFSKIPSDIFWPKHLTGPSPVVNVLHLDGASANVWFPQCPWKFERHNFLFRHSSGPCFLSFSCTDHMMQQLERSKQQKVSGTWQYTQTYRYSRHSHQRHWDSRALCTEPHGRFLHTGCTGVSLRLKRILMLQLPTLICLTKERKNELETW